MNFRPVQSLLLTLALLPAAASLCAAAPAWPAVQRETKPWTRWWWLGSAVDKANLTRELEAIAAAGFGGVEITPIYGAKGYEDRFLPFLSPPYLEMLAYTGTEARRLGLGVDMATGTGWPFGGPQVTAADAELKLAFGPDGAIAPVPTRFKVKRSAPGGEGWVLNPYSALALTHYLEPFTSALATLPPGTLRGQFHDSFEYQATWANEVPAKFQELHGYDLREHAAKLAGQGDPDTVARIKADYRTTLGALHLDYIRAWVAWTRARGEVARNQAHGSPGNLLDLYGAADIPETEIFGSIPFPIPGFRRDPAEIGRPGHPPIIHHFAASAAHVLGKRYASSETFTWLREHFHVAPSEMKPELDAIFLAGINHVFYHGDAYSPEDAPWPGWLFYASSQINTRNPLWRDIGSGLNAYITRAQSLLQAGHPDNDLLVYWPADDLWHNPEGQMLQLTVHASWLEASATGVLMQQLTAAGFAFDLISDEQLAVTEAVDGQLQTPGGTYRLIVVPRTEHMSASTLRRLVTLARAGATVFFVDAVPADVPGFGRLEARRQEFKAELARLQLAIHDTASFPGKHGSVFVAPLSALLGKNSALREPMADFGLKFIRRKLDDGHAYFIANQTAQPFTSWLPLTRPAPQALRLDPLTGDSSSLPVRQHNARAEVFLQLEPGESLFVRTQHATASASPALPLQPAGATVVLDGEWRVAATTGGPELPPAFSQRGFGSWATQGNEWERFGGTARYETEFTLPAGAKADDWLLDLGDVRETARVFVNGREHGLVWALPMRTNIGRWLKPGKNTLALEVTNLAANRIRDLDRRGEEWKKFHEINFVNIFYKSFDASTWPLQPSGLLGPVTLTPLLRFAPP